MIEEKAVVIAVEKDYVWVRTQRTSTCQSCAVNKGCGTGVLSKVLGQRYTEVKAVNQKPVKIGDVVTVAVSEDTVLKGSLLVYCLPLVLMMLGAVLVPHLLANDAEWLAILSAFVGLGLGFAGLAYYMRNVAGNSDFQPTVTAVEHDNSQSANTVLLS